MGEKRTVFLGPLPVPQNSDSQINVREVPTIDSADYMRRIDTLFSKCRETYDYVIIYGDREHYTNIEYFTGYDPRFEESILILSEGKKPILVVGNEGAEYANIVPFPINIERFSFFSLPKQPSESVKSLTKIFSDAGLYHGSRVGILGWKLFESGQFPEDKCFDLPYFIMSELVDLVGIKNIRNANSLMIDSENGLLHNLDAKELVLAEVAGFKISRSVYRVLKNLRVGITEVEASGYLNINGEPCSIHPNVNFGSNVFYGVASPTYSRTLCCGDLVAVGMGQRRALIHRVGLYIEDFDELDPEYSSRVKRYYETYFRALSTWYESIAIGVKGGEVYEKIDTLLGGLRTFGIGLNPGHSIQTAEWVSSPFYKGSEEKLHSGMMIQCDFTASRKADNLSIHAEDGIIIADEDLRMEMEKISPSCMKRIKNRKAFMRDVLGIKIADEVLPTSDLCGVVFPCMKNPSMGYRFA